jgi:hypothetical protein
MKDSSKASLLGLGTLDTIVKAASDAKTEYDIVGSQDFWFEPIKRTNKCQMYCNSWAREILEKKLSGKHVS